MLQYSIIISYISFLFPANRRLEKKNLKNTRVIRALQHTRNFITKGFTNIPRKSRGKNKPIIRNECLLPSNSEFCVFPASTKKEKKTKKERKKEKKRKKRKEI
jgi:hypothetical protein